MRRASLVISSFALGCAGTPPAPAPPPSVVVPAPAPGPAPKPEPEPVSASEPADVSVSGRLPAAEIQRVVRADYPRIRACYQRRLAADPDQTGRVVVRFVIAPDGSVSEARDDGSTLTNPSTISCIIGVFIRLRFPEPDGGSVTVVYPLHFSE
jgi:hypothetical protein